MPDIGRATAGRLLCHALIACLALGAWSVLAQEPSLAPPAPALSPAEQPALPELPETRVEGRRNPNAQPDFSPPEVPDFSDVANLPPSNPPNVNDFNPQSIIDFSPQRGDDLLGREVSASQGTVGQADIQDRAFLRPASVLELVPGLVATQHSGSGKANQYFLRGFNLDHGTDFLARVNDVPINLPTHAHGQGYLDLNFLIPELIERIDYAKGPYYAQYGDFSSAGAADIRYFSELPFGMASVTYGTFEYVRAFAANSENAGQGTLLYAYEQVFNNGPWDIPEGYNKFNGVVSWTVGDEERGVSLSTLAYRGYWNATNQIARQAYLDHIVSRFGSLSPTDGGETNRITLNAEAWQANDETVTRANVYVAYYDLNLYSNFTYFLDDPINGDQIQQVDRRVYNGANLSQQWLNDNGSNTLGFQFRNDTIFDVALNHTAERHLINPVSRAAVDQQSYSLYAINETHWTDWMRTNIGLRGDFYRFDVDNILDPADSGKKSAAIFSPKTGITLGPWYETELFVNWGLDFHSNDARGVTNPVDPATPLVRTDGGEVGLRSYLTPEWQATVVGWYLESSSELVFVGDAGTTEPAGASHRAGIEVTNFYQLSDWVRLDADYAWVRPRLMNGLRIPNAVENVFTAGIAVRDPEGGFFVTPRIQLYGPAALNEDNTARSGVTTIVNMDIGYNWKKWRLAVELFNILDAKANDIVYFYESRPPGLPAMEDYHFHPVVPSSVRASLQCIF